jgi:hypothetical protein
MPGMQGGRQTPLTQMCPHFVEDRDQQILLTEQQGCALGPACGDIRKNQRLNKTPFRHRAAVPNQIRLKMNRRRIISVIESPDRDAAL